MVDLIGQYAKIKDLVDVNLISCIESGMLINGPEVKNFSENLKIFLNVKNVIPCANGTDALQIAFMALDLNPGDEIICPSWTYIATAEAAAILGLKIIFCDVDFDTFNLSYKNLENLITKKTKAIVPVHLYGQSCEMEEIIRVANKYNLKIIEDNAQAIGCNYTFTNGEKKLTGTIGDIGITSFYPSKNLGAYGDGGALFCDDDILAEKIRLIANHGQKKRYHHDIFGCNSRLDSLQAVVLNIKLKKLNEYNSLRAKMAEIYDSAFTDSPEITPPSKIKNSSHVYHQYTIKVDENIRDDLKNYLKDLGIPTMIYYPIPIHLQEPYKKFHNLEADPLTNTELLSKCVLSLPIHTEIENSNQDYIIESVLNFFR